MFGAEPFDPFTCGAADFPPDIQSKLDEMQVTACLWIISKWTGVNEQLMELTVGTAAAVKSLSVQKGIIWWLYLVLCSFRICFGNAIMFVNGKTFKRTAKFAF